MNCHLWRWNLAVLIQASVLFPALASTGEPPSDSKLKAESPAQTISKALDQPISVEFANAPLQDAVTKLTDQTKLNFVLDRASMQQLGIVPEQSLVTVKLEKAPLRVGLRRLLSQYNLGYAVVGDMVLITTEDMAIHRQMPQRINLDFDRLPLDAALRDLAKRTVTNLVLDGRVINEAQTPLTLKLDDLPP